MGAHNWRDIAERIPGRTGKQWRERWLDNLSPDVLTDKWSADEDLILIQRQSEFGNAWVKIRAFLPGRSIGAIKNRWNWFSRRDIPHHTEEFEAIARSQVDKGGKKQDVGMWNNFELFEWYSP
jgi:hypothetical protein